MDLLGGEVERDGDRAVDPFLEHRRLHLVDGQHGNPVFDGDARLSELGGDDLGLLGLVAHRLADRARRGDGVESDATRTGGDGVLERTDHPADRREPRRVDAGAIGGDDATFRFQAGLVLRRGAGPVGAVASDRVAGGEVA